MHKHVLSVLRLMTKVFPWGFKGFQALTAAETIKYSLHSVTTPRVLLGLRPIGRRHF